MTSTDSTPPPSKSLLANLQRWGGKLQARLISAVITNTPRKLIQSLAGRNDHNAATSPPSSSIGSTVHKYLLGYVLLVVAWIQARLGRHPGWSERYICYSGHEAEAQRKRSVGSKRLVERNNSGNVFSERGSWWVGLWTRERLNIGGCRSRGAACKVREDYCTI